MPIPTFDKLLRPALDLANREDITRRSAIDQHGRAVIVIPRYEPHIEKRFRNVSVPAVNSLLPQELFAEKNTSSAVKPGVAEEHAYSVKKIDSDYFDEA
jgi:hypothetical protein